MVRDPGSTKFEFFQDETQYLGIWFGNKRIQQDYVKDKAIQAIANPTCQAN